VGLPLHFFPVEILKLPNKWKLSPKIYVPVEVTGEKGKATFPEAHRNPSAHLFLAFCLNISTFY
jgi:hypothetical protein